MCRVDRVTEAGGDVGRLNVVGGAEVSTLLILPFKLIFLHQGSLLPFLLLQFMRYSYSTWKCAVFMVTVRRHIIL